MWWGVAGKKTGKITQPLEIRNPIRRLVLRLPAFALPEAAVATMGGVLPPRVG